MYTVTIHSNKYGSKWYITDPGGQFVTNGEIDYPIRAKLTARAFLEARGVDVQSIRFNEIMEN